MARPDSATSRIRFKIAQVINPMPDAGEAWCLACCINNGSTVIVNADSLEEHLALHDEDDYIRITSTRRIT
jgi:uncharacterized protein YciI